MPTLTRRLRLAAMPSLAFGAVCAAVLLAAVGYGLYARGFAPFARTGTALLVLALPPAAVAALAACLIDCRAPTAGALARGVLAGVAIAVPGFGAGAAAFNIAYRSTYPADLAPVWTAAGLHEALWTGVSTTYQFLIIAPRLYWPWAPLAVAGLAVAFALRRPAMGRFAAPSAALAGDAPVRLSPPAKPARDPATDHHIEEG